MLITTSFLTRAFRLTRVALHLARGVTTAGLIFPWLDKAGRADHGRRWAAGLLRMLAIRVQLKGAPPPPGAAALLAANHVSWLDPFVINAVRPVRFIAKSEVRRWPVIGWLTAQAGTLFVVRSRRHHTAHVNQSVVGAMRDGETFAVFPEGTTTDGSVVLPFHASLLQPAFDSGAPLVPVALRYLRADGSLCTEAAYDGDKTIFGTLRAMAALPSIRAELQFLAPLTGTDHQHRRELARAAEQAIASALRLALPRRHAGTTAGLRAAAR
ncbi:MAG TPA: lysophospholipid acyltransferase family protein [Burkholderiales bacterium]|nr:lysophospholipid acyltransferase family protein [Burkholderiales bacterium]